MNLACLRTFLALPGQHARHRIASTHTYTHMNTHEHTHTHTHTRVQKHMPLKSPSHRWGEYQYHWTIRIRIRFLYDSDSIFCTQISDPVAPVDPTWQDLAIAAASDTPLGDRRPRQRRRARSPLGTSAGSPIRTARVRGEAEQLDKTQTVILPYPVGALFRYLSRLPLAPQAARSAVV
eukprot:1181847-Prorocentrum_minimum.AAC.3